MDKSPGPVSRGALERVLARASELQTATGDASDETMTEAQLIELAQEVGLSPEHVRQALAEERARGEPAPNEARGLSVSVFGDARLAAQRVVPGNPEAVLATLDRWMQGEETMHNVRQRADRLAWQPRQDFFSGLRRAFGSQTFLLESATEVAATVVSVDKDKSLVALTADMSGKRNTAMAHLVSWTVVGAAGTAVLSVLGFMTAIAAAPVVVLSAAAVYGSRRALRNSKQRAHMGLEQVLDRLERRSTEPRQPSLLQRVIDSALPPAR